MKDFENIILPNALKSGGDYVSPENVAKSFKTKKSNFKLFLFIITGILVCAYFYFNPEMVFKILEKIKDLIKK